MLDLVALPQVRKFAHGCVNRTDGSGGRMNSLNTNAIRLTPLVRIDGVVYPDPERTKRYHAAGLLSSETLTGALRTSFTRSHLRNAIDGPEGPLTYAELDERSERLGASLLGLGLQTNDRVLFQLGNSNELIVALIACLKAGLIPVCTLPTHREREIEQIATIADARAIIVQGDNAGFDLVDFALQMCARVASLDFVIVARGAPRTGTAHVSELIDAVSLHDAQAGLSSVTLDPWQVALFQLSGGTTSVPKIIPRFSNEYLLNARACGERIGYSTDDRAFVPLPIMHNASLAVCVLPILLTGGSLVLSPRLDPPAFIGIMLKQQPTWLGIAGPVLSRLKAVGVLQSIDRSFIRGTISTGSAALAEEVIGGHGIHVFGMTEGVIMLPSPVDPQELRHASVGSPVSIADECRILIPGTEVDVAEGEVGELAIRGPYTISGYYRAPDRNLEAFTRDGFYRSGDLMRVTSIAGQRVYQFEGRIKEVIDRANEKINCEEVERALRTHPAIDEVAVVGLPCPEYGERGCAFIISSRSGSVPDVKGIGDFLREFGLAKFKWPERLEFVAEFPVTMAGKLDRAALRSQGGPFLKTTP
jgi:2,3-dihydroxybenzoate-AMP ligase